MAGGSGAAAGARSTYPAISIAPTLDELVAAVHAREPAVFRLCDESCASDWETELRDALRGLKQPVRYQSADNSHRVYRRLFGYACGAWHAMFGCKSTLDELENLPPHVRWGVSGVDQKEPLGQGGIAACAGALAALNSALAHVPSRDASRDKTGCWLSSAGSVTHLHWDAFGPHNFHLLVAGRKRALLFPPSEAAAVRCLGGFRYALRFVGAADGGVIDPSAPNAVSPEARGLEAMLTPGDLLFVPAYYWHFFASLGPDTGTPSRESAQLQRTTSISLTRWWYEREDTHPREPPLPSLAIHVNLLRYIICEPLIDACGAVMCALGTSLSYARDWLRSLGATAAFSPTLHLGQRSQRSR